VLPPARRRMRDPLDRDDVDSVIDEVGGHRPDYWAPRNGEPTAR
jgi:hypothetical protein